MEFEKGDWYGCHFVFPSTMRRGGGLEFRDNSAMFRNRNEGPVCTICITCLSVTDVMCVRAQDLQEC